MDGKVHSVLQCNRNTNAASSAICCNVESLGQILLFWHNAWLLHLCRQFPVTAASLETSTLAMPPGLHFKAQTLRPYHHQCPTLPGSFKCFHRGLHSLRSAPGSQTIQNSRQHHLSALQHFQKPTGLLRAQATLLHCLWLRMAFMNSYSFMIGMTNCTHSDTSRRKETLQHILCNCP